MASDRAPGHVRERLRSRSGAHRQWRRRRRRRRRVLLVLGAALVLAVLDALWVGTAVSRELRAARDQLSAGADAVLDGRLGDARSSFILARTSSDRVSAALAHPMGVFAEAIPGLGDDVSAVKALAEASGFIAEAGQEMVRAADGAGWDGSTIPGLDPGGSLQLDGIRRATPALESAARLFRQAEAALAPVWTEGLIGSVRDAVETARTELADKGQLVADATTLSRLLPGFLGAEGSRRYLLITLGLADPRGSGGFPGGYGVLSVGKGGIKLERFGVTSALASVPRVDAPKDMVARYARFGALTRLIACTYSPDFPTSARQLMALWQASGQKSVDGVIAVDSVFMSNVLEGIGPVVTSVWPEPIASDNVSDVLNRQTFLTTDPVWSNRVQNALADALWGAVFARPLPARAFADALVNGARERHLQLYSADPAEQRALNELGASGHLTLGADPLMVAWDGAVGNRAGYFADKSIDYRAAISADGSAQVSLDITLTNGAPTAPPSILLGGGPPGDVPIGYYQAFVNVYVPKEATDIQVNGGALQIVEQEFGIPVVLGLIGGPSGSSETLRVTYRLPDAVAPSGDALEFRLDVQPLPALNPDQISVRIELPQGADVLGTSAGVDASSPSVIWTAAPVVPQEVWVRYALNP